MKKAFWRGRGAIAAAVGFLLVLQVVLSLNGLWDKSPTFDELVHIAGGVNYWRRWEYNVNPESGVLPQYWASIPPAVDANVKFQRLTPLADQMTVSKRFFYASGNDPDALCYRSRLMMVALGALFGLALFFWSRSWFGAKGGLVTLALYALSPTILANGRLVLADLPVSFAFALTLACFCVLFRKPSARWVGLSALALSVLFLTKMSAFFIVPVYFALMVFRASARSPLPVNVWGWRFRARKVWEKLAVFIGAGMIFALTIYVAIWAAYGFRFAMVSDEPTGRGLVDQRWKWTLSEDGWMTRCIRTARDVRLLPEAYLQGFAHTYKNSRSRWAFLDGEARETGWVYYFPLCAWWKTPFPEMAMGAMAIFAALALWKRRGFSRAAAFRAWRISAPIWVFGAVFLTFTLTSHLNIGFRHILPLYPLFFLLCGVTGRFIGERGWGAIIVLLLVWEGVEAIRFNPDYLAYFNPLAGGPKTAYRRLIDSSLDWGQDLKRLRQYLEREKTDPERTYVSYFGSVSARDAGLPAYLLPGFFEQDDASAYALRGGTYAISATMLWKPITPGYTDNFDDIAKGFERTLPGAVRCLNALAGRGPQPTTTRERAALTAAYREHELWRFALLCHYLRKREPDDFIGYSILIYRLTDEDVRQALSAAVIRPGRT